MTGMPSTMTVAGASGTGAGCRRRQPSRRLDPFLRGESGMSSWVTTACLPLGVHPCCSHGVEFSTPAWQARLPARMVPFVRGVACRLS
ncbi:hypothetical protein ThrDRAFT_03105 [Frankia casuarinae]|nr:hypothetical protein CcI6DRAFT_04082 [Frankia sp. CcI6]EYT91261.1 hypothetical protein ThrDRAFT_03105 [Frankia casuarinae]KDA41814.1 hypothetical protein BMG523Draft_03361 [Frankia sp. BMG5.23]KEZ35393.1 hypothetical protein CEDDRAFT_03232 [Frankia sp. CeD]KFB06260.1 hypothetical protein ALLO2DRAFT_00787 [Frankia sp. Allo2]